MNGKSPNKYDPKDFGADNIVSKENWKGSGYTHYTAYSKTGGQISWNEVETSENGREVVDVHISSRNIRDK